MRTLRLASALAHFANIKMFGFLNHLLRKKQDVTTDSTSAPAIEPTAEAVPASSSNSNSSFRATPRKNLGQQNGNGKSVEVSLQTILDGLPVELQPLIRQTNVGEQTISVPLEKILAQLSRGAVKVSFKELRQSAPGVFTAENNRDEVLVALPLAEILSQLNPALIARRRVQRQVEVPPDISSPFDPSRLGMFGGDDVAETRPVAPAIPSGQVSPAPSTPAARARGGLGSVPPPSQPAMPPPSTARQSQPTSPLKLSPCVGALGTPGTKFLAKYATPNEVVSRAAALDGVAGVLIVLPDGLMVANRLPPDLNADTFAAFLPQIFGKVSQCTKELRMGDLNNLNFTVGNVPWKIFRGNAIFFAAFGRKGEPMPTAQLAALAAELDHKPK